MDDAITTLLATDVDAGFERLVRTHADRIYAFALALTGSRPDAEEVAQDAFVRAHHALCRYSPERRLALRPSGWLHTIALNVVRNRARRRVRAMEPLDDRLAAHPDDVPEAVVMRGDDTVRLRDALAALPTAQREAVVLRHVQGFSSAETSRLLGRPEGTVKSDVHRGLARLRTALAGGEEVRDGWSAA